MTWKKFLKTYNGWLGYAVGTALFFAAPSLYMHIDPTAGRYDAGYIMPIIYAGIVLFFASAISWTVLRLTAPGVHKQLDKFLENEDAIGHSQAVLYGFILYAVYMLIVVLIVIAMV